jgi:hypothetical protein
VSRVVSCLVVVLAVVGCGRRTPLVSGRDTGDAATSPSAEVGSDAAGGSASDLPLDLAGDSPSDVADAPDVDRWEPMASDGAPSPRYEHTVISTGSTLIVWGGADGTGTLKTGAIYTP